MPLLFSLNPIRNLKGQQLLTWDQLILGFSHINKLGLMVKKFPLKLELLLDLYSLNGEISKIGLLVLFLVVEELPLFTENVFWDLTPMPDLVLEKLL